MFHRFIKAERYFHFIKLIALGPKYVLVYLTPSFVSLKPLTHHIQSHEDLDAPLKPLSLKLIGQLHHIYRS